MIGMNAWNWAASVNHLHLQAFYYPVAGQVMLPIERQQKALVSGEESRPMYMPFRDFFLEARRFEGNNKDAVDTVVLDYQAQLGNTPCEFWFYAQSLLYGLRYT